MIWDDLVTHGWMTLENGIPEALWKAFSTALDKTPDLMPAQIGRTRNQHLAPTIRGDSIQWLEQNPDPESPSLAAQHWLEELRHKLNRELFLGLRRFEAHWAVYPPGSGYDLHLDQHRGQSGRKITFIVYLNENWIKTDGGELELHLEHRREKILPIGGRLVLFRSELIPHQVHPAVRTRKSLTGWFRDDDPPW